MNRRRRITTIIILGLALVLATNIQPVKAHILSWGVLPEQQFEYSAYGNRQDIGVVDIDYSLAMYCEDITSVPS